MAPEPAQATQLKLPVLVTGPIDVGRLLREVEAIDNTFLQLELRKTGQAVKLPKTSIMLDECVELNKLNLLQAEYRQLLLQFLKTVKTNAPKLHISFSADPAPVFTEKLMAWLRKEIHPLVLVTIGLQPNIGAGCVVRSTNKQFDLSLKQNFAKQRDLLMSQLALGEVPEAQPQQQVAEGSMA